MKVFEIGNQLMSEEGCHGTLHSVAADGRRHYQLFGGYGPREGGYVGDDGQLVGTGPLRAIDHTPGCAVDPGAPYRAVAPAGAAMCPSCHRTN